MTYIERVISGCHVDRGHNNPIFHVQLTIIAKYLRFHKRNNELHIAALYTFDSNDPKTQRFSLHGIAANLIVISFSATNKMKVVSQFLRNVL